MTIELETESAPTYVPPHDRQRTKTEPTCWISGGLHFPRFAGSQRPVGFTAVPHTYHCQRVQKRAVSAL